MPAYNMHHTCLYACLKYSIEARIVSVLQGKKIRQQNKNKKKKTKFYQQNNSLLCLLLPQDCQFKLSFVFLSASLSLSLPFYMQQFSYMQTYAVRKALMPTI